MKIYIATKFESKADFHLAREQLERLGHTITHDWTVEDAEGLTGQELERYLKQCAIKDMYGVQTADAVLAINHPAGKRMFVEMGMAIGSGIPVFIARKELVNNIFSHIEGVYSYDGIGEAIEALDEYARLVES